ncbi:mitochondrial ribosomal protein L11 [Andrena cerasifolii]|uniref:mitochondrial ribosomal protein L11 n=1 Tax=Andrena cerasifolii TaxID=2819439 RepID=UPI00403839DB
MSKIVAKGKMMKKVVQKVDHSSRLRVIIPAGLANAKPPLGSQLGQRNINVANFCKDFNNRTADIKEGIPMPCRVKVKGDGTYDLVIHQPPATYFLKHAAGLHKGQMTKDDKGGMITFKHLYEIACIKAQDPPLELHSLEQICKMLVGVARTCGIKVVQTLDPEEYAEFRKEREQYVEQILEEMRLTKEAKMLRTA